MQNLEERFRANVEMTGRGNQVEIIKSTSFDALVRLNSRGPNQYDLIYIDGSHMACDIFSDAALAWNLLKVDGVLIFDDYLWDGYREDYKCPGIAIDAFLKCYVDKIELLFRDDQVIVRRKY